MEKEYKRCEATDFCDLIRSINYNAHEGWELVNFVYAHHQYKAILVRSKGFNICPKCCTAFETGVMYLNA